jgi:hypothetical protein
MPANRQHLVGQNGTEPKIVPLNLVLDYPVAWSRYKVLRDLVQNFYDAVGCRAWQERFSHSLEDGVLYLRARNVGFSYDWLVPIGASTKRERPGEFAGFFGEGFKIASLCAVRDHNWEIEMASRDWELQVVVSDMTIDGRKVPSLASFFYPENPLLGEEIWNAARLSPQRPRTELLLPNGRGEGDRASEPAGSGSLRV